MEVESSHIEKRFKTLEPSLPMKGFFVVHLRNTKAREEFGDFSDVGKLAFAGQKKLPEEIEAQHEQERRLQKISTGYEQFVSRADYITYSIHVSPT